MPFGIIDTESERPLPGTELLIRKEQTTVDGDTSQLKRVVYKAGGVFSEATLRLRLLPKY